jgi:hypothetical protein
MQLKLTNEDFKGKSIFIATPMYGGNCTGMYTKSSSDLAIACTRAEIPIKFYYLFNESLITRARNYCVDEFLRSDCTHMMFIDSDIGFNYQDVLTLLHFTNPDEGRDIVTGPYPKKTIAWEKIARAMEKGYGKDNPHELENFTADYVFNPIVGSFKIDELVEIKEGGTGFMCIHRSAFEKYAEAYPELKYLPDHARSEHFDGSKEITAFFDTIIDPESKRYLSEDYMFSQYARKIGLKVWMCPWMKLKHVGSYIFGGSFGAMAAIQASPTASKESNKKHFKNLTNKQKSGIIPKHKSKPKRKNRRSK